MQVLSHVRNHLPVLFLFFFVTDAATTEIYTLSLHDALPIYHPQAPLAVPILEPGEAVLHAVERDDPLPHRLQDRKSTRLNSSHSQISYAVFCLKKKKR